MEEREFCCPFLMANNVNAICRKEKCAWYISITTSTEVKKMCAITAIANDILSGGNFRLD